MQYKLTEKELQTMVGVGAISQEIFNSIILRSASRTIGTIDENCVSFSVHPNIAIRSIRSESGEFVNRPRRFVAELIPAKDNVAFIRFFLEKKCNKMKYWAHRFFFEEI